MSDDPSHFSGFSKQKSIWGTPLSQQQPVVVGSQAPVHAAPAPQAHSASHPTHSVHSSQHPEKSWSPRKNLGLFNPMFDAHQPPTTPAQQQFDYLYYRPTSAPVSPAPVSNIGASGSASATQPSTLNSMSAMSSSLNSLTNSPEEDLIPTAIVVKNIPFAIKKEQLVEVMTQLGLPLPYAFNYHFDNGVFRGLAFANYSTADETAVVIATLHGREIGGRKLRVEYKKMLPLQERERIEREKRERRGQLEEQHTSQSSSLASSPISQSASVTPQVAGQAPAAPAATAAATAVRLPVAAPQPQAVHIDLNDEETLDLYTSLVLFSAQPPSEVMLSRVSPYQALVIHKLCSNLGLGLEDRDGRLVVVSYGRNAHLSAYPSAHFPQ